MKWHNIVLILLPQIQIAVEYLFTLFSKNK